MHAHSHVHTCARTSGFALSCCNCRFYDVGNNGGSPRFRGWTWGRGVDLPGLKVEETDWVGASCCVKLTKSPFPPLFPTASQAVSNGHPPEPRSAATSTRASLSRHLAWRTAHLFLRTQEPRRHFQTPPPATPAARPKPISSAGCYYSTIIGKMMRFYCHYCHY